MTLPALLNHLLQSTAVCVLIALLAFVLRQHRAGVRHGLWLVASLKFLLPFAVLTKLGSLIPRPATPPATAVTPLQQWAVLAQPLAAPFESNSASPAPAFAAAHHWGGLALFALWLAGFLAVSSYWLVRWRRMAAILHRATPVDLRNAVNGRLPRTLPARITPARMEPGIFGIFRPVLLLPEGIATRLSDEQLSAVVAHELCHIRRRDNLTAALHMLVECLFWFYPLVWWLGARLVEERERACDEAVLANGGEPDAYAEGLLQVCHYYLESPLACVAGVTGADIKRRVIAIMDFKIKRGLSRIARFGLLLGAFAVVAIPVAAGSIYLKPFRQPGSIWISRTVAPQAPATTPKFDVASIRECPDPSQQGPPPGGVLSMPGSRSSPGRLYTDCVLLRQMIGNAYSRGLYDNIPLTGGPKWTNSAFYEINATAEGKPSVKVMSGPMLQTLLEDRFQLKIHRETKEGPVYFLTVAHGQPKLHSIAEGSCKPWPTPPPPQLTKEYCTSMIDGLKPAIEAQGATLDEFSSLLRVVVGRPVINKTGIAGQFDIRIEFSREGTELARIRQPIPASPGGPPSIFTALQEQLGLKLESGQGPVDTLVIDQIEKPTGN